MAIPSQVEKEPVKWSADGLRFDEINKTGIAQLLSSIPYCGFIIIR
nr:MAG TPA: hypothetical protein [Caudoviricetes sp.]DAY28002.1 MAG TPA: hypothetical protein [Caudoviricetes sp.]